MCHCFGVLILREIACSWLHGRAPLRQHTAPVTLVCSAIPDNHRALLWFSNIWPTRVPAAASRVRL